MSNSTRTSAGNKKNMTEADFSVEVRLCGPSSFPSFLPSVFIFSALSATNSNPVAKTVAPRVAANLMTISPLPVTSLVPFEVFPMEWVVWNLVPSDVCMGKVSKKSRSSTRKKGRDSFFGSSGRLGGGLSRREKKSVKLPGLLGEESKGGKMAGNSHASRLIPQRSTPRAFGRHPPSAPRIQRLRCHHLLLHLVGRLRRLDDRLGSVLHRALSFFSSRVVKNLGSVFCRDAAGMCQPLPLMTIQRLCLLWCWATSVSVYVELLLSLCAAMVLRMMGQIPVHELECTH